MQLALTQANIYIYIKKTKMDKNVQKGAQGLKVLGFVPILASLL